MSHGERLAMMLKLLWVAVLTSLCVVLFATAAWSCGGGSDVRWIVPNHPLVVGQEFVLVAITPSMSFSAAFQEDRQCIESITWWMDCGETNAGGACDDPSQERIEFVGLAGDTVCTNLIEGPNLGISNWDIVELEPGVIQLTPRQPVCIGSFSRCEIPMIGRLVAAADDADTLVAGQLGQSMSCRSGNNITGFAGGRAGLGTLTATKAMVAPRPIWLPGFSALDTTTWRNNAIHERKDGRGDATSAAR